MKTGIHPTVHANATVTCTSCGAIFHIPGTIDKIHVEVCSSCHPIYTGKYRGIMKSGRVEKFQKRLAVAKKVKEETVNKPKKTRNLTPEEKLERKLQDAREKKIEKSEKKQVTKK